MLFTARDYPEDKSCCASVHCVPPSDMRLIRYHRLPRKTLLAVALLFTLWFIIMVFYLDDLVKEDKGRPIPFKSKTKSKKSDNLTGAKTYLRNADGLEGVVQSTIDVTSRREQRWFDGNRRRENSNRKANTRNQLPPENRRGHHSRMKKAKYQRRKDGRHGSHVVGDPEKKLLLKPEGSSHRSTADAPQGVNMQLRAPFLIGAAVDHMVQQRESPPFLAARNATSWLAAMNGRGPAENAIVNNRTLSRDEILDIAEGRERHSFNVAASERLVLNRSVPDLRPASCPQVFDVAGLSRASVVICFHNEAWTTLLRTVQSVLDRSPIALLQEIILVDDASTYDYLGSRLERYLSPMKKVLLVRSPQRLGLIRARMLGVQHAAGEVLVFLDSHCECATGWLQPLLLTLRHDRKKVVTPMLDIIKDDTLEYVSAGQPQQGSFDWKLNFVWKDLPAAADADSKRSKSLEMDPIRTPTMIGGLFAVDKHYFLHLGQYDAGMDIWGSENIELSFRVWMCGGSIEILPCSHVGHLFRPVIPYGFPKGGRRTIFHNAARVADTWLDGYGKFFYAAWNTTQDPSVVQSMLTRRQLRTQLGCHDNFSWYLNNVVPDMVLPLNNAEYFGQLQSQAARQCLTPRANPLQTTALSLVLTPCQAQHPSQVFQLTVDGQLVHQRQCLSELRLGDFQLVPCNVTNLTCRLNQHSQLACAKNTHGAPLCLELHRGTRSAILAQCTSGTTPHDRSRTHHPQTPSTPHAQQWTFTHHFDSKKLQMRYL